MELYDALLDIVIKNIEGMNYEEALNYLNNDAIPASGSVSGLLYTVDTKKLAKDYHDEIVDLMEELGFDKALYLNDMTWFAWEALILGHGEQVLNDLIDRKGYELIDKKGDKDDN